MSGFVDLDRHRLIDVVAGRSAAAVSDWLGAKPKRWLAGIATAVIDPYSGYALGLAEGLPRARMVVDHFHAVRLANQALDENTLGLRSIMFTVDDIDATVAGLRAYGAELVGEVAQYQNSYRLCYVRGPGIIVALAEQLQTS